MQLQEFLATIKNPQPPAHLNAWALSLWYDANGNWEKAHSIIQDMQDITAAHIHAYLHRKEGDAGNAGYWYGRASAQMPTYALNTEWEELVKSVLAQK